LTKTFKKAIIKTQKASVKKAFFVRSKAGAAGSRAS
jgi:hypothetical protein